ncbi:hypothetical protein Droror1_Dr00001179 [Drosera rotundifolia]
MHMDALVLVRRRADPVPLRNHTAVLKSTILERESTRSARDLSHFLDPTMMPTENFCGRKRYLPDLNVPLLNRSGSIEESHSSTKIHNLGEGIYKVGEGSLPYVNVVPYNSDAVSDLLRSQTQSNSSFNDFLDLTMMPTENFCGRKRYLPDLNVPLLNTDAAFDSLELTLVPTTATPHPPPAANVGLDVQPFSTEPASRQQPKTQSKRSFEDESIVNSLSFYTAISSHHSDLEYSFKTAASSWHSTGSFFTDSIPEIEMGTESQVETETRDLRMRFASRFWEVGASGNGSFSVLKQQILDTMVESVVSGIVQECMQRFFDCL